MCYKKIALRLVHNYADDSLVTESDGNLFCYKIQISKLLS